jgi:hypothetical protein
MAKGLHNKQKSAQKTGRFLYFSGFAFSLYKISRAIAIVNQNTFPDHSNVVNCTGNVDIS